MRSISRQRTAGAIAASAAAAILSSPAAAAQAAPGDILQGTPLWVYALLALLVYLGAQALRPRVTPVARLLVTPAVFIAWGLAGLAMRESLTPLHAGLWGAVLLLAAALAVATTRMDALAVDRARGLVRLPGSWAPLARNLLIFGAKYGIAVAMATNVAARDGLALLDVAVSGAAAGYFLGWLGRLAFAYQHAPDASLATRRETVHAR